LPRIVDDQSQPIVANGGVLLAAARRMHEQNPMLGLRGVRLGLVIPGLFAMQVRATRAAAAGPGPAGRTALPADSAKREVEEEEIKTKE
jgi:signal transduction protein with GAF and PtsI domain